LIEWWPIPVKERDLHDKSFLWKGQWISTDEWTKHIKTWDGMKEVTVEVVNRGLKKVAATVSEFNGVAGPRLFVNERVVNKTVEVKDAGATAASVGAQSFETVNKNVHFYYLPTTKGKTPVIPTDTKSWQGFCDNNKIASRSN
jgi:hypothetical protein